MSSPKWGTAGARAVRIGRDGVVFTPVRTRLADPPEFDLMARLAGLRLHARWGGWNKEAFTADSWRHVSVYTRAADAD